MKKLFQKVKLDAKFQRAGEGHKLTDEPSHSNAQHVTSDRPAPVRERPITESQANAAIAALERHEKSKAVPTKPRIKHKITAPPPDLPPETRRPRVASESETQHEDTHAIGAVKFVSALTGDILQKKELNDHYKEVLLLKLGTDEAVSAACTMIHTLNKDSNAVEIAVVTLCKYIDNVIANATEVKFRKIRKGNKAFSERVSNIVGAEEFLNAVGFKLTMLNVNDVEELYFVLPDNSDVERLKEAKTCLGSTKPLSSKLYRDRKVFKPSDHVLRFDLPKSFYSLTLDEIRREQDTKTEEVELGRQLRTKEMREKPVKSKKYHYTIIRVRFPDGHILQGTFGVHEKYAEVRKLVGDSINVDWAPYVLKTPTGQVLEKDNDTLISLSLVPSVVLNLTWIAEVHAQLEEQGIRLGLKADLLDKIEVLS